jgi:SAM-dependent methyltransferase
VWRILVILAVTVGPAYFVLSATTPLLQRWVTGPRLYAFSNAGSLAGLLSYPLAFEPLLPLKTHAILWTSGLILYVLLMGACLLLRAPVPSASLSAAGARPRPILWFLLSTASVLLMLSSTTLLTQDVPPVPFLWILPLSLYLLSYIFCFAGWSFRKLWIILLPAALATGGLIHQSGAHAPFWSQRLVCLTVLFAGCMACHGALFRHKPEQARLPGFYLWLAAGGAFGGLLASVLAPALLTGFWEYPAALLLCGGTVLAALWLEPGSPLRQRPMRFWGLVPMGYLASAMAIAATFALVNTVRPERTLHASRSFYGLLRVVHREDDRPARLLLLHGGISHGFQFLDEELRREPVSYFSRESGVGRLLAATPRPARIGLIGLGAGILAAHGSPGDLFRFYELDPGVIQIAREHFTYLDDSPAGIEIVPGDARLSLEREQAQGFDVLILDAFSGGAVPLHLLTREAFATYLRHLKPGGVLALNLANRHLDLEPLARGLAAEAGLKTVRIEQGEDLCADPSLWFLASTDPAALEPLRPHATPQPPGAREPFVFTDGRSDLFRLLN